MSLKNWPPNLINNSHISALCRRCVYIFPKVHKNVPSLPKISYSIIMAPCSYTLICKYICPIKGQTSDRIDKYSSALSGRRFWWSSYHKWSRDSTGGTIGTIISVGFYFDLTTILSSCKTKMSEVWNSL